MSERKEIKNRPEWVRWALKDAQVALDRLPISYQDLAVLFERQGIRDEHGRKVIKSRIGNFAAGRNKVPDWFIEGIRKVADPEGVVLPASAERKAGTGVAIVRFHENASQTISVPGVPPSQNYLAVAVDTVSASPWITPRDVVIVETMRTNAKPNKVYAYTKDGRVHFGKAQLTDEAEIAMTDAKRNKRTVPVKDILGEAVVLLIDYTIGSLEINAVINTRGLEFPEW